VPFEFDHHPHRCRRLADVRPRVGLPCCGIRRDRYRPTPVNPD
jgi:hypothetical protein